MSRIGKLPVPVPPGVDVNIDGRSVTVKGPKGTLNHVVAEPITVAQADGTIALGRPDDERLSKSLHGLSRTLIANMVTGVTDGYTKTLEIVGTGYRVTAKGSDLEFALGFSHPVLVRAPEGITFRVETPTRFAIRTRARACATKAKPFVVRPARQGRSNGRISHPQAGQAVGRYLGHPPGSQVAAALPAAQEGRRKHRATAFGHHPLVATPVRTGRRRQQRHHAGVRVHLQADNR
jgi:large subunit ribosomal protein L6